MPQIPLPAGTTDADYVLGLLRATGILCVYGSGFGLPAEQGFLRVVFLAPLDELGAIYDDMAAFTADFVAGAPPR
jgi:aspartate/methionine/tyrosine aminotransferase